MKKSFNPNDWLQEKSSSAPNSVISDNVKNKMRGSQEPLLSLPPPSPPSAPSSPTLNTKSSSLSAPLNLLV